MKSLSCKGEQMRGEGIMMTSRHSECMTSMESTSELVANKKKLENMTVLLRHYQTELESQKIRRDGVETVSRLLAESRQENTNMKKRQAALEMMVKNLQNKLALNGIAFTSEMGDDEVIVPGTSKQTLTNLALENKRLRNMLKKDSHSDIESYEHLSKSGEISETGSLPHSQQNAVHLEAENKSMRQKIFDLETLFKSSNNEKDRQLIQYQNDIQKFHETAGKVSESSKLLSCLPALKEQLKSLMTHCQDFDAQLQTVQIQEPGPAVDITSAAQLQTVQIQEPGPAVDITSAAKQADERLDSLDGSTNEKLREENQKLQDRVEEVTKMNHRWQEFYNDRTKYTQSLEQKVQELEQKLEEAVHKGTTPEINYHIEQVLEKSQKEMTQVGEIQRKAQENIEQLSRELVDKNAQIVQLQSQVAILSQSPQTQSYLEACNIIEHLKAQVQVCTEDFEKERQDRMEALKKLANLQEHNSQIQKLNKHFQTLMRNQESQVQKPIAQEQGYFESCKLQPRGRARYNQHMLVYDCPATPESNDFTPDFDFRVPNKEHTHLPGPMSLPGTNMELIARGPVKSKPNMTHSLSAAESSKHENFLTCPKCNKEFSEEHQGELLAHMDVCWE